jgi:hypothetical protein
MDEPANPSDLIIRPLEPGHAPARATYAKAGFRHVPISRFFLAL